MKNCPNCGAPLEPYKVKCEFCGTMYFDLGAWLEEDNPCFINYNTYYMGKKTNITTLAIPKLESIEANYDTIDCQSTSGNKIARFRTEINCDLKINFHCVKNSADNSLFKVKIN